MTLSCTTRVVLLALLAGAGAVGGDGTKETRQGRDASSALQPRSLAAEEPAAATAAAAAAAAAPSLSAHEQGVLDEMLAHADGAWKQTPSAEQLLANTTAASVARTQLRIKVGEAPTASELCAFGRALPAETMTIIITGSRQQRIAAAGEAMCLPNVHVINGHPPINDEAEITPSERSLFMDGSMEVLTLGEIAIHISHQRALADCLQIQKGDAPCLILEDDFSLSGPLVADRFTAAFDQLPASWDLLFLGRCMDNECGSGGLRISAAADLYGVAAHSYPVGLTDYHVVKEKVHIYIYTYTYTYTYTYIYTYM